MKWRATLANSLWVGGGLPAALSFRRALRCPAEAQWRLLRDLLARNASCAYGKARKFAGITNYQDFTQRVPLVDYDDLEPWITRIRGGEDSVLTTGRVTHLIPTSGSCGARKLIPFTRGLQRQFDRAISPWIADLVRQDPDILSGPAYWSITPALGSTERETSVVPIGFADDASYLGGLKSWLVRAAMAVPKAIAKITDSDAFRFETLLALLREPELRLIAVWHPSFLTLLLDALPRHWEKILAQLHREKKHRARELERADPHNPVTLWPRLRAISCWADGQAEIAVVEIRRRFPGVLIQAKGLLATEAFVTIPYGGWHPLAVNSHFFEFIDDGGRIRMAHELREREEYEVAVTTAGGLWRYRLRDRVRVTGFSGATPSLRFIGRAGNVSDLFGEKLSETFVTQVVAECLTTAGVSARFALLAPDQDAEGWRYTLHLEGAATPSLAGMLDHALRRNPHYAYCRDLGQLLAPRISFIEHGYETYTRRLTAEGRRLGDIKPALLSGKSDWNSTFSGKCSRSVLTAKVLG